MSKSIRHQQVGYIRVSTTDQNTDRQLDDMELDKTFIDKCSGKDTQRPALKELMEYVRAVDTVHVHDISRLARNLADLINIIKTLNAKEVSVRFHKENLLFSGDESNPMQDLMLNMLGSVYQFERSMLLERQREGIAKAKAAGKYKGKQRTVSREAVKECLDNGMSIRKTAAHIGCGPSAVQIIKKEFAGSSSIIPPKIS
jgi:DNA invertase Pin-like site-specific DNA recombinase